MTGTITWTATLTLMALFTALSLRYFKKIGRGAAAPIIDPSWPIIMQPASPSKIDAEMTVDDGR